MCLQKAFPDFEAINHIMLDYHRLGFATTNDFLRMSEHFPHLLRVVGHLGGARTGRDKKGEPCTTDF